jgi:hypothetical protein
MARPFTFTVEEIEQKIKEYFKSIDENPLYKYEQRKGSINVPKDYQGSIADLTELIKIPIPRIYQESELCHFIGFAPNWIDRTLYRIEKKHPALFKDKEDQEESGQTEENLNENNEENLNEQALFETKLGKILKRAKSNCSEHNKALASAGLANPIIVSAIEGLKQKADITSNDNSIQLIGTVKIVEAKDKS